MPSSLGPAKTDPDREIETDWFGQNLRVQRLTRRLTLDQLSRATGISKATLSRIENSKISPTYDAIVRIAAGLGVETQDLFISDTRSKLRGWRSVTRRGGERVIETPHYLLSILCADIVERSFMMFSAEIKARSRDAFEQLMKHEGEEQIYVGSGEVEVLTELYEPTRLAVGESMSFDSLMGHAIISTSPENAHVIWTCSSPLHLAGDVPDPHAPTISLASA